MKTINIMLVDDHAILRSGLKMLLNNEQGMQVVAEASNGKESIEKFKSFCPDIIILDITLPDMNGLEVAQSIRKINSKAKIVVLTMHDNEHYMKEFLKIGINGYVLKKSADAELINAVHKVNGGEVFVDPALTKFLLEEYIPGQKKKLSPREEQTLKLVVKGYTNKEISANLKISTKTVETYRQRITEKLNISSRPELLEYAIKNGLFEYPLKNS